MNSAATRIAIALLSMSASLSGQASRDVWVATQQGIHQVARNGALIQTYSVTCSPIVAPCQAWSARDSVGRVYVASLSTFAPGVSGSIRIHQGGAQVGNVAAAPTGIVADAAGAIWYTHLNYVASVGGVTSLSLRRCSAGTLAELGSLNLPTSGARLASHPVSGVWVQTAGPAAGTSTVSRVTPVPAVAGSVVLPSTAAAIAADAAGRLWVACNTSPLSLQRIAETSPGVLAVDAVVPVPGIGSIAAVRIDGCGLVRVHAISAAQTVIVTVDPQGQLVGSEMFPVPVQHLDFGTDGSSWGLSTNAATGSNLIHLDGGATTITPLGPAPILNGLLMQGDATGLVHAAVVAPLEDSDGDGTSNRGEFERGTDPFDPASAPPVLGVQLVPPSTWQLLYADADPAHPGLPYQLACSAGATTGFALGPGGACPRVPLDFDALFEACLTLGPPVFNGFAGTLGPAGTAIATVSIPPGIPPNLPISFSGATLVPLASSVAGIANAVTVLTP